MSRGQRACTPSQFPRMKHWTAGRLLKKRAKFHRLADMRLYLCINFQPMVDALNDMAEKTSNIDLSKDRPALPPFTPAKGGR